MLTESQVRLGGNRTFSRDDLAYSLSRHPDFFGEAVLRSVQRKQTRNCLLIRMLC